MSMPRGLHPETEPQRKGRWGHWSVPRGDLVEYRDAPMSAVGKGLGLIGLALVLVIGATLAFGSAIKPGKPLSPSTAEARFRPAGPHLLSQPQVDRAAIERVHRGPDDAAIDRAMNQVVSQGWGDGAPPPGRAEVATNRAKAGQ